MLRYAPQRLQASQPSETLAPRTQSTYNNNQPTEDLHELTKNQLPLAPLSAPSQSMVPERNLRNSFNSSWKSKSDRFRAIFDTFCAKWNLYGMQDGRPLLQKLSVNSTPYGTMIFIPNYWSLDPKRDLDWGKISRLHKARGQQRQGPLLAEGLEQRRADLKKLEEAEAKARKFGLRGDKRHEFLCLALGWDVRTDRKRLARLRKSCLGK